MHEGNTTCSVKYYCDMLCFNTVTWWPCDDYNITPFIVLPDNVYYYASDHTTDKNEKKNDERFR